MYAAPALLHWLFPYHNRPMSSLPPEAEKLEEMIYQVSSHIAEEIGWLSLQLTLFVTFCFFTPGSTEPFLCRLTTLANRCSTALPFTVPSLPSLLGALLRCVQTEFDALYKVDEGENGDISKLKRRLSCAASKGMCHFSIHDIRPRMSVFIQQFVVALST